MQRWADLQRDGVERERSGTQITLQHLTSELGWLQINTLRPKASLVHIPPIVSLGTRLSVTKVSGDAILRPYSLPTNGIALYTDRMNYTHSELTRCRGNKLIALLPRHKYPFFRSFAFYCHSFQDLQATVRHVSSRSRAPHQQSRRSVS